jgi:hypothetical protein
MAVPIPVVRVVIDGTISHQATWSYPVKHLINRVYSSWSRGPALILQPKGHSAYLQNMRPSAGKLLRGCERLRVRAVWAVGDTSGPAGAVHGGALCMLVLYGRRVQPPPPRNLLPALQSRQQDQEQQPQQEQQTQPLSSLIADVDEYLDHLLDGAALAAGVGGVHPSNSTATIGSHLLTAGNEIDVDGVPCDDQQPGAAMAIMEDPLMQDASRLMHPLNALPAQHAPQQPQGSDIHGHHSAEGHALGVSGADSAPLQIHGSGQQAGSDTHLQRLLSRYPDLRSSHPGTPAAQQGRVHQTQPLPPPLRTTVSTSAQVLQQAQLSL